MHAWPFADPKNVAVFTLRSIVHEKAAILYVAHNADDGAWQFMDGTSPTIDDAMVVALEEIAAMDPSVKELADLPLGWHAWRRTLQSPWKREPDPPSQ